MKISNETKVGILAVFALTGMILGFNFLKGNGLLGRTRKLYAVFDDLGTLDKSNQVKINGLPVGAVYDLAAKDKEVNGIVVTINLTRAVNIPTNSVAFISSGLVGSSYITIEKGTSTEYLKNGDTILTRVDEGLLGDLTSQVNPTLSKARDAIDSLKLLLGSVNQVLDPATTYNLRRVIANLVNATSSLNELLNTQTGALAQSLGNMSAITANLKKNNDTVSSILHNVNQATDKMARLDLASTLDTMQSTLAALKTTIDKLNSNKGTLGKLMNDDALYNNLNYALVSLETLLDDVRLHPKRYVNVSVFGKKDKTGPITSPALKDTVYRK